MIPKCRLVSQRTSRCVSTTMLFAAVLCLAHRADGQTTYDWNAGSHVFAFAPNWTPAGGPPGAGDTARFNVDNPGQIVTFGESHDNAHVWKC